MAYQSWSVVAGEIPTAAKWNILGTNDAGFNDGSALGFTVNNTVPANALATNAIYLGSVSTTSDFSTASGSYVQVTNMTLSFTNPQGGRKVLLWFHCDAMYNTGANSNSYAWWDGTVGSGSQLNEVVKYVPASNSQSSMECMVIASPAAGASKTYNVGTKVSAGTSHTSGGGSQSVFCLALLI